LQLCARSDTDCFEWQSCEVVIHIRYCYHINPFRADKLMRESTEKLATLNAGMKPWSGSRILGLSPILCHSNTSPSQTHSPTTPAIIVHSCDVAQRSTPPSRRRSSIVSVRLRQQNSTKARF